MLLFKCCAPLPVCNPAAGANSPKPQSRLEQLGRFRRATSNPNPELQSLADSVAGHASDTEAGGPFYFMLWVEYMDRLDIPAFTRKLTLGIHLCKLAEALWHAFRNSSVSAVYQISSSYRGACVTVVPIARRICKKSSVPCPRRD